MELVEGVADVGDVDQFVERLGRIGGEHGCAIAALDARYLVGREHVARAVRLANRAFERGENVADARAIEVLLYAAGRRQIDRALELGVSTGEGPIVVVVDEEPDREGTGERDDTENEREEREEAAAAAVERALGPEFERSSVLGAYDEKRVRDFFAIAEAELEATDAGLDELVGERVALLDVEK